MASAEWTFKAYQMLKDRYGFDDARAKSTYGAALEAMTDASVAVALDVHAKEYTGSYAPPSGMFRKWGQGDRPMLGSRLDWSKGKLFQDQKGRWLAYNPDIEGTMPPTPEESAAQEKLDRSGVRDFAGLGKIIDSVNQQERGRSKDA